MVHPNLVYTETLNFKDSFPSRKILKKESETLSAFHGDTVSISRAY